jgi:hypothetical protein
MWTTLGEYLTGMGIAAWLLDALLAEQTLDAAQAHAVLLAELPLGCAALEAFDHLVGGERAEAISNLIDGLAPAGGAHAPSAVRFHTSQGYLLAGFPQVNQEIRTFRVLAE